MNSMKVAAQTLFEYLHDSAVEHVESNDENSVYTFACGCVAVRSVSSADCYVELCGDHRPRVTVVTANRRLAAVPG